MTWEIEEKIRNKYLELFLNQGINFENKIILKREGCEDPKFYFTYFYFILLAYLII